MNCSLSRPLILFCCFFALAFKPLAAQAPGAKPAQLQFVVVLTRHGVRSPTGAPGRYAKYARAAWPRWDVAPGYLTAHGFEDMKLFGAWDRSLLAGEGLLNPTGCADSAQAWFYADSDERTRESGRALAEGMFPGCPPAVHGLPQGTRDSLFHAGHGMDSEPGGRDADAQAAARRLMRQYRPQIEDMDRILARCGPPSSPPHRRVSLFDASSAAGQSGHGDNAQGALNSAASLSENFLLEYAQGMPMRDVGWGCVSPGKLNAFLAIHNAVSDQERRAPSVARRQTSGLLNVIRAAIEQAVTDRPAAGALDPPGTRVLFLVGHDTNLTALAGLLRLNWTTEGRHDDTPPGSALVFELWRSRASGNFFVRGYYTAQTLDQMRNATPLTAADPPLRVPLTLDACSTAGGAACSWTAFSQACSRAIDSGSME